MVTKEEARDMYKGKFFYEVIKPKSGGNGYVQLIGPLDNIRYAVENEDRRLTSIRNSYSTDLPTKKYKFVQIISGKAVAVFTEEEILVTDREL